MFENAWAPAICSKVHDAFPREVRDIIWSNLYAEHQRLRSKDLYTDENDLHKNGCLKLTELGAQALGRPYFEEEVVGSAIAREVAEAWYKSVSFKLQVLEHINLEHYLAIGRWCLDLRPSAIIRRVYITYGEQDDAFLNVQNLAKFRCLSAGALIHVRITSSNWYSDYCLGCGQTHNLLDEDVEELDILKKGFSFFEPALLQLKRAGLRHRITFEYMVVRTDAVTTLTLHNDDEGHDLLVSSWEVVILMETEVCFLLLRPLTLD